MRCPVATAYSSRMQRPRSTPVWLPRAFALAAVAFAAAAALAPAAGAAGAGTTPGATLTAFVEAAGNADAAAMWSLLSAPTRKRLGPDLARFRRGAAVELGEGLGRSRAAAPSGCALRRC